MRMKYKALVSFSGLISAAKGETLELNDDYIAQDLLRAKYIEEVKNETKRGNKRAAK